MTKIFISYRRSDSLDMSQKIHDALEAQFGDEAVFFDKHDIHMGEDWRNKLETEIVASNIVLVIIGSEWLSVKKDNASEQDKARIFHEDDVVRWEVQTALRHRTKWIVPVLVNEARMPAQDELPEVLQTLCNFNATTIRSDPNQAQEDIDRIVSDIQAKYGAGGAGAQTSDKSAPEKKSRAWWWRIVIAGITSLALIIGLIAGIIEIASFFGYSIAPSPVAPTATSVPIEMRRQLSVTVLGTGADCVSFDVLMSAFEERFTQGEFADVAVLAAPDVQEIPLGAVDIVVDCHRSLTEFRYVPIVSLFGLWELETLVIESVRSEDIMSLTNALLHYIDVEKRSQSLTDFERLSTEWASSAPIPTAFETPDALCGLAIPANTTPMSNIEAQLHCYRRMLISLAQQLAINTPPPRMIIGR